MIQERFFCFFPPPNIEMIFSPLTEHCQSAKRQFSLQEYQIVLYAHKYTLKPTSSAKLVKQHSLEPSSQWPAAADTFLH